MAGWESVYKSVVMPVMKHFISYETSTHLSLTYLTPYSTSQYHKHTPNHPPTMLFQLSSALLLAATALIPSTTATCQLQLREEDRGRKITDDRYCRNQGEGQWTFGMQVGLTVVPSFGGGGNGLAGASGNTIFTIYDNTCTVMGSYLPCQNEGSIDRPYYIAENFMPYELDIEEVDMDVGNSYFKFAYGDGLYSIGNNHCVCTVTDSGAAYAQKACGCAFPVDGKFKGKRGVGNESELLREIEFRA